MLVVTFTVVGTMLGVVLLPYEFHFSLQNNGRCKWKLNNNVVLWKELVGYSDSAARNEARSWLLGLSVPGLLSPAPTHARTLFPFLKCHTKSSDGYFRKHGFVSMFLQDQEAKTWDKNKFWERATGIS